MILTTILIVAVTLALAFPPALLYFQHHRRQWLLQVKKTNEEVVRLKLQLETVLDRTARLREELSAADRRRGSRVNSHFWASSRPGSCMSSTIRWLS